jgi:hypothetical protein
MNEEALPVIKNVLIVPVPPVEWWCLVVNVKSKLMGHQREHQSQRKFLPLGIIIKLSKP